MVAVPVKVLRSLDALVGAVLRMSFADEAAATFAIDTLTSTLDRLQIGAPGAGVSDTAMVRAVAAAAATSGLQLPLRELYAAGTPGATAAAVVLSGCGGLTTSVFASMLDASCSVEVLSRALAVASHDALPELWATLACRAGSQPADSVLATPSLAAAAASAIAADPAGRFATRLASEASTPPSASLAPVVARVVSQAPKAGWLPLFSRAMVAGASWAAVGLCCARAAAAGAPPATPPAGEDRRSDFYNSHVSSWDFAAAAATPALMSALVEFVSAASPAHRWVVAAAAVSARQAAVAHPLLTIAAAAPVGAGGADCVRELAVALEVQSVVGGGLEVPLAAAMVGLQRETAASPEWWRVWCAALATLPAFAAAPGTLPSIAAPGRRLGVEPLTRAIQTLTALVDATPAGAAPPPFPFDAVLGALGVADTAAPEVWPLAAALAQLARREPTAAQATLALSSAVSAATALRAPPPPPPPPGTFSSVLSEALEAPTRAAAAGLQAAVALLCGGAVAAEAAPELHVAAGVLGVVLGSAGAAAAVPLLFAPPLVGVIAPLPAVLRLAARVWGDSAVPPAAEEALGAYVGGAISAADNTLLPPASIAALAAFAAVRCPAGAVGRAAAQQLAAAPAASDSDLSLASPHLFAAQAAGVGARLLPAAAPLLVGLARMAVGSVDAMMRVYLGVSAVLAAADAAAPLPAEAWVLAARELSALWAATGPVQTAAAFRPQWGLSSNEAGPTGRTAATFCDIVRNAGGMPQVGQVDLSQLGLGSEAFVAFASLAVSPTVTRYTLYGNPLAGDAACQRVLAAVAATPAGFAKVTSLDMDGCGVEAGTAAVLAQLAEGGKFPALESLDLRRNEGLVLGDGDALARVAKACPKLTCITVPSAVFPDGHQLLGASGANILSRA